MKKIKKIKLTLDKQIITNLTSLQVIGGNGALEGQSDKLLTGFDSSCESSYCD